MFADPSVQFGLQFQTPGGEGKSPASVPAAGDAQTNSSGEGHAKPGLPAAAAAETDTAMPQPEGRRVVALDAFRKK
jgi:hypothetical protein